MQNHPNIKLNAYHMKIRDCACFRALVAKLFDFPSYDTVLYGVYIFKNKMIDSSICRND